jgi:hypothetical protein
MGLGSSGAGLQGDDAAEYFELAHEAADGAFGAATADSEARRPETQTNQLSIRQRTNAPPETAF